VCGTIPIARAKALGLTVERGERKTERKRREREILAEKGWAQKIVKKAEKRGKKKTCSGSIAPKNFPRSRECNQRLPPSKLVFGGSSVKESDTKTRTEKKIPRA